MYLISTLRILAIGIRGSFILVLPYFLTPADVGLFGLIAVLIAFGVMLIGGDFYTYSQRQLTSEKKYSNGFVLKNQLIAHLILYCILFPVGIIIYPGEIIPIELLIFLITLVLTEHISFEMNRILLAFQLQNIASYLSFFRVFWIILLIPLMFFSDNLVSLKIILNFWLVNVSISILIYLFAIRKYLSGDKFWENNVSLSWIFNGFKLIIIYFLSTLILRSLFVLDRVILENNVDLNLLGVYTIYIGLAMVLGLIVDGSIIQYYYPKLIKVVDEENSKDKVLAIIKEMIIKTGIILILGVTILLVFTERFLGLFPDPIYIEYIEVLWWLLLAAVMWSFMLIPHFVLYAYHLDKQNLFANSISFFSFLFTIYLYSPNITMLTMSHSLLVAFSILLSLKIFIAYQKISQNSLLK